MRAAQMPTRREFINATIAAAAAISPSPRVFATGTAASDLLHPPDQPNPPVRLNVRCFWR